MNRRFPLATVLRVRRVQEDLARVEVAEAKTEELTAEQELIRAEHRLDVRELPIRSHAVSYVAAMVARRSLAGEAFAAARAVEQAKETVAEKIEDWQVASGKVTALENLEQRHAEAVRHEDDRLEQAAADELGTRAFLARQKVPPQARRPRAGDPPAVAP